MSAKVPLDILFEKEANLQEEIARLLEKFTKETGFIVMQVRLVKHTYESSYSVRVSSELPN